MAGKGAPFGNNYAVKAKRWSLAIDNALAKRSKAAGIEALEALAEKLLAKCDESDMTALKELGDRLEGKPAQSVLLGNEDGKPLIHRIEREIVNPNNKDG